MDKTAETQELKNLTFNIVKVKMKENELKGEREICLQAYLGFL